MGTPNTLFTILASGNHHGVRRLKAANAKHDDSLWWRPLVLSLVPSCRLLNVPDFASWKSSIMPRRSGNALVSVEKCTKPLLQTPCCCRQRGQVVVQLAVLVLCNYFSLLSHKLSLYCISKCSDDPEMFWRWVFLYAMYNLVERFYEWSLTLGFQLHKYLIQYDNILIHN